MAKNDLGGEDKNKNKNFLLGMVSGIAVLAVIGMVIFGTLYFTNKSADDGQVAGEEIDNNEQQDEQPVNLEIAETDWVLGSRDAKVKVFEFSDFQCPYCARFHEVMHQIVEEYPDDVAWIYKQFPIRSHPLGPPGAVATECAGEQGKFWQMADMIFENQDNLTEDSFAAFAQNLGLDMGKYNSCYENNPYEEKILTEYNLGVDLGVRGTPSNFINGQLVPGAVPYESMKQIVEDILQND